MKIERLEIKNYRVFRHVVLAQPSALVVLVGANGTGKSTLFDVFGLLRDALQDNVHTALSKRGGFHEVRSREQDGPIVLELGFRARASDPPSTYTLAIGEQDGRAVVVHERLEIQREGSAGPLRILDFRLGVGSARTVEPEESTHDDATLFTSHELDSPDILALKGLGQFRRVSVITQLRRLIEGWHLSDVHVPAARPSHEAGHAEHLSPRGENLLLCIKEPEHRLYHTLLPARLEELRDHGRRGGQVMVSTHSPILLDAAELAEIYWLEKRGGFSTIHRARDDEQLRALVDEGDLPGALWRQGLFGCVDP